MPTARKKAVAAVSEQTAEDRRKALLRKAYGQATQALREIHQPEFLTLYRKYAAENGVEYTPRPNAEQRAEQEFESLVEQYPHLLDRFEALRDRQAQADAESPAEEPGEEADGS